MLRTDRGDPHHALWDADTLRDPHAQADKASRVEAMFDAIAPTYERVNTVATLGQDAAWRRQTVAAAAVRAGDVVLDVCCGTGDMMRAFARATPTPRLIIGVDSSAGMLALGEFRRRKPAVQLIRGDAMRLPLADESADVISCAFGVRNFHELQAGLDEMSRVGRPGARVVILEFATPKNAALRWAHHFYCYAVLPRLATLISRDKTGAYRYLPRSIHTFETTRTMTRRLKAAGFGNIVLRRMNFGGVVLYVGVKPSRKRG